VALRALNEWTEGRAGAVDERKRFAYGYLRSVRPGDTLQPMALALQRGEACEEHAHGSQGHKT